MMKDVIRALQTGSLAEIALVAFVLAFVLVMVYTFTISKKRRDHAKNLPLEEDTPVQSHNGAEA
ncbi:MAG: cbb3-type cytochrome c oxidase subunit 3 [Rubricoccaceae bacterium]|nr:cbb3-type cytochrome c oxidase subunit 3 [Rubricoccaceae bacterium]